MGRPSKKDQIDLDKVIALCIAGCTIEQIAVALGVCKATIYNYQKQDPEFLDTIKKNTALANAMVQRSLWERANGYNHPEEKIFQHNGKIIRAETIKHYPPDTAAAFIWLKNRDSANWKDKQEVEHSGGIGLNLQKVVADAKQKAKRTEEIYRGEKGLGSVSDN